METTAFQSMLRSFGRARGRMAGLLRLRPFDVSTAEGRSRERYRRVALSGLATGVSRGVTMLTLLIAVPLMLKHLGLERYGLWSTLQATMVLFVFADLGLGSGLMNTLAAAQAREDRAAASASVSSAFFLVCTIAAALLFAFATAYAFVQWPMVFNVTSPLATREAGPATAVFALCFILNMPLGLVQRIHAGFQEAYVASLWQAAGSLLALGGIVLTVIRGAGLPWVVLALAGAPVVAAAGNALWLFGWRRPWLLPRTGQASGEVARQLLRTGFLFFVLQLCAAVAYQAGPLVIARVMGARAVPLYSVPMVLFQMSPALLSLVMTPLWPAYAESIARGDVTWIKRSFARSIRWALALNIPWALLLVLFGDRIISLWAGAAMEPRPLLLLCMGLWTVLNSFNSPLAMLLNGLTVMRFQIVASSLMTVANLALAIVLTPRIGIIGVVVAMIAAQTVFILIPAAVFVPRLLARMRPPHPATA